MQHGVTQLLDLSNGHQAFLAVGSTAIMQTLRTFLIVTAHQPTYPIGVVAADLGNVPRAASLLTQQNRLPMDFLNSVAASAKTLSKSSDTEVRFDRGQVRHGDLQVGDLLLMIQNDDLVQDESV